MNLYDVAYHHATAHGVLTAVHIPDSAEPVPDAILNRLHADEAAVARTLRGYRQVQFVGGRIALGRACEQIGARPGPILPDHRGTPLISGGLSASVSHKREIAIGMVASNKQGTLGVDVEEYAPMRLKIADQILTPHEVACIADQPDERRWISMLIRFSIKESIYKALDPYVRRYVGFHEATVTPDLHGAAAVTLNLKNGEGPFEVDARYCWLRGRLLTSVRIQPAGQATL